MKLYCFLLIIILLCLLYDNNLYEGNDQYNTDEDRTTGYIDPSKSEEINILDSFGWRNLVPDSFLPDELTDETIESSTCDYNQDCVADLLSDPDDDNWGYNTDPGDNDNMATGTVRGPWKETKVNCVDCFKCKTGGAFVDAFYGHACDAIVACLDDMNDYSNDNLPYIYAYKNTDWSANCNEDRIKKNLDIDKSSEEINNLSESLKAEYNKNVKRKQLIDKTCSFFSDSTLLDTLSMGYLDRTASCHLEIMENEYSPF